MSVIAAGSAMVMFFFLTHLRLCMNCISSDICRGYSDQLCMCVCLCGSENYKITVICLCNIFFVHLYLSLSAEPINLHITNIHNECICIWGSSIIN